MVGCSPWGSLRVRHDCVTSLSLFLSCIGEGSGHPLQCSCLENPRDAGAWWAAVYGVTQSRTRLQWLSSSMGNLLIFLEESNFGNWFAVFMFSVSWIFIIIYYLSYLLWYHSPFPCSLNKKHLHHCFNPFFSSIQSFKSINF